MMDVEVTTASLDISISPLAADRDAQAQQALFESFIVTVQHFFRELWALIRRCA